MRATGMANKVHHSTQRVLELVEEAETSGLALYFGLHDEEQQVSGSHNRKQQLYHTLNSTLYWNIELTPRAKGK